MNTVALLAFALWALFLRYLPQILRFVQLQRFSKTIPGPSVGELIANVKKGGKSHCCRGQSPGLPIRLLEAP